MGNPYSHLLQDDSSSHSQQQQPLPLWLALPKPQQPTPSFHPPIPDSEQRVIQQTASTQTLVTSACSDAGVLSTAAKNMMPSSGPGQADAKSGSLRTSNSTTFTRRLLVDTIQQSRQWSPAGSPPPAPQLPACPNATQAAVATASAQRLKVLQVPVNAQVLAVDSAPLQVTMTPKEGPVEFQPLDNDELRHARRSRCFVRSMRPCYKQAEYQQRPPRLGTCKGCVDHLKSPTDCLPPSNCCACLLNSVPQQPHRTGFMCCFCEYELLYSSKPIRPRPRKDRKKKQQVPPLAKSLAVAPQ